MNFSSEDLLTISTTSDRVELARRTHRQVSRTLSITFCALAAVILAVGAFLAHRGSASLPGVIVVAAVFVVCAVLFSRSTASTLRKAERYLSSDGTTLFVAGSSTLTIGDTVVPYERITCMYAVVEGEVYSSGGLIGEKMAYRMDLSENRPGPGRAVGVAIGTTQRRRLYRDGAKSTISLAIGIDRKSTLNVPEPLINGLKTLPKRGDDPGRIDVPFGAFLGTDDLERLLGTVYRTTGGTAFPIAVVSGTLNWSQATTGVCNTRQKIWEEFPTLTATS